MSPIEVVSVTARDNFLNFSAFPNYLAQGISQKLHKNLAGTDEKMAL
jgi:hypothetical protein